jgi:hypothetical protein
LAGFIFHDLAAFGVNTLVAVRRGAQSWQLALCARHSLTQLTIWSIIWMTQRNRTNAPAGMAISESPRITASSNRLSAAAVAVLLAAAADALAKAVTAEEDSVAAGLPVWQRSRVMTSGPRIPHSWAGETAVERLQ